MTDLYEEEEDDPDANLIRHEFTLRIVCWTEQPEAFVASAAASGAATMLEGWTQHPSVMIEGEVNSN